MVDIFTKHFSEILAFVEGFFAGGITVSLVTLNFNRRNTVDGSGSVVDQSKSRAGGDIVGGNKNNNPPSQRSR